jgi:hypothetical protein
MRGFIKLVLFTKYYGDQVKEGEVGGSCSTNGHMRSVYKLLVGKPKGKIHIRKT